MRFINNNLTNRFKKNSSIEQKDKTHKPAFDKSVYEGYNGVGNALRGVPSHSQNDKVSYKPTYENTQNQWEKPETRRRENNVYIPRFQGNNIIKDGFNVYNPSFKDDPEFTITSPHTTNDAGFIKPDSKEKVWDNTFKKQAENQWYNKIAHGSFKDDDWFNSMVKNQEKAENWYKTTYGKKEGKKEYNALHNRLVTTPFDKIKEEEQQFVNYKASDFKVPEIQPVKYSYNSDESTVANVNSQKQENISSEFDYNTRLSYNQTYNPNVKLLQKRLSELGYLDMSDGGWGYFGFKTQDAVNRYKNDNGLGNTGADKGVVGKQTWTSLGLLCREQKDIDAGVQIKIIGDKQYFDVTNAIMNAVNNSKGEFALNSGDLRWFKNQVGNAEAWNVKASPKAWSQTLGISEGTYRRNLIFFGRVVSPEDIGNITYGYLGKAAGFSDEMLYIGSMGNQAWTHLTRDWDNEFADHEFIQLGIDLYNGMNIEVRYGKG